MMEQIKKNLNGIQRRKYDSLVSRLHRATRDNAGVMRVEKALKEMGNGKSSDGGAEK